MEQNIKKALPQLLKMARDHCWNTISDHCLFILSEIKNDEEDFSDQRVARKKVYEKKVPKSFEEIMDDLKLIYDDLYDVNLYIYKALKDKTIIEICYYPKSAFDKDYFEKVKDKEPMLHCKLSLPPYRPYGSKEKFDINWGLGGLRHQWNMFWWRRRIWK